MVDQVKLELINKKLELAQAVGEMIDYCVDIHLELIKTKDPVKRIKLEGKYKKSEKAKLRLINYLARL